MHQYHPKSNWLFNLAIIILCVFINLKSADIQAQEIPFELTSYNNISIKAIFNKKDTVKLMLHTGASSVTITEAATAKIKSLQFTDKADSVQSWGGNANVSALSYNNELKITDFTWDGVKVWKDKYSGQETDGKFGLTLFRNKVVAIDFDKKILTVSSYLPNNIHEYSKLEIITENALLFVKATCNVDSIYAENKFMIHSGYYGGILLDDIFAKNSKIGETVKITGIDTLRDAFGNKQISKKGIIPSIKIGEFTFKDVPIAFFEGAIGKQKISIIGGEMIKQFNFVIDSERRNIYIKPSKNS